MATLPTVIQADGGMSGRHGDVRKGPDSTVAKGERPLFDWGIFPIRSSNRRRRTAAIDAQYGFQRAVRMAE